MAKATTCPVCNGTGKITETTVGTAVVPFQVDCHGCGGKGWVEVSEDSYPYYPIPPIPTQPYSYITPWYTFTEGQCA